MSNATLNFHTTCHWQLYPQAMNSPDLGGFPVVSVFRVGYALSSRKRERMLFGIIDVVIMFLVVAGPS